MAEFEAVGMIETRGYVGAIEAADAAVKSADVSIISIQKADAGLVTIIFRGDVASVRAAVDAASAAARKVGEMVSTNVIARPAPGVAQLLRSSPPALRRARK